MYLHTYKIIMECILNSNKYIEYYTYMSCLFCLLNTIHIPVW